MDPFGVLGVTASIIACIQLTVAILKRTGPSDHSKADLGRVLQVITGFSGAYEALKWCMEINEDDQARLSALQHLEGPLKDAKAVLEFLQKRLENSGLLNQFILGSSWDGKLNRCLKRLEDSKALFELAMHSDQHIILVAVESYIRNAAEDIRDVKDVVNDNNSRLVLLQKVTQDSHDEAKELHSQTTENISRITTQIQNDAKDLQRREAEQTKQKFIKWLLKVDYTTDHNTAIAKHHPETGVWLIGGQEYIDWRERPGSFLWLYGIPGCGKTILCSTIIENLRSHSSTNPPCSVAFFYFSFQNRKKLGINGLLCSLIAQLATQSQHFSEAMQKSYQEYYPGEPPLDVLKVMLRSILEQGGDKYIIIDALDEVSSEEGQRAQLCALLQEIYSWELQQLHILTTSRQEPIIERVFDQIQTLFRVPIQNSLVDADIRHYVEAQLVKVPRLAKWSPQLRQEMRESLVGGAHGMFRWVYCQIDTLQKCLTANAVKKALKSLPKSLDDTYDRILLSIDPDFHEYAIAALKWLVFAQRPLLLCELAEAAIIRPRASIPFDIDNRFQSTDDLLQILSSLVTIQNKGTLTYDDDFYAAGFDEDTSPVVRLAHFSVEEYLISGSLLNRPAATFHLDKHFSSQMMLECCLSYLENYSCSTPGSFGEDHLDEFPLLSYSCEYWPNLVGSELPPPAINLLSKCLSTKRWLALWMEAANTWHETFEEFVDYSGKYWPASFDDLLENRNTVLDVGLYIASQLGIIPVLNPLIKLGADPNRSIKVAYEFPIIAATSKGEIQTVRELIQIGSDLSVMTRDGKSALHAAASRNKSEIARLLLESGLDVNIRKKGLNNVGGNALLTAICHSGPSMIRLLFEKGAVVDLPDVCSLLYPTSKLESFDKESRILILEFSRVSDRSSEEFLELILRVAKVLEKRQHELELLMMGKIPYKDGFPDWSSIDS